MKRGFSLLNINLCKFFHRVATVLEIMEKSGKVKGVKKSGNLRKKGKSGNLNRFSERKSFAIP